MLNFTPKGWRNIYKGIYTKNVHKSNRHNVQIKWKQIDLHAVVYNYKEIYHVWNISDITHKTELRVVCHDVILPVLYNTNENSISFLGIDQFVK